jgi:hypothetical protein
MTIKRMNAKNLNDALVALVEKKMELSRLNYSAKEYDTVEEELHKMEDDFMEAFGKDLESVLEAVHQEHCSDTEVLEPIAYLARRYEIIGQNADGSAVYEVNHKEGVWVDADKFPGKEARLLLIPNPARIILNVGPKHRQEVWKAS